MCKSTVLVFLVSTLQFHTLTGLSRSIVESSTKFQILDEFGQNTSILRRGGTVKVDECQNPYVYSLGRHKLPIKPVLRIPDDFENLPQNINRLIEIFCQADQIERTITIPANAMLRLSASGCAVGWSTNECPGVNGNACIAAGKAATSECLAYIDYRVRSGSDQDSKDHHYNVAYLDDTGTCLLGAVFYYSTKSKPKQVLNPGTVVFMTEQDQDAVLVLSTIDQTEITCRLQFEHTVTNVTRLLINVGHLLSSHEVVYVDCSFKTNSPKAVVRTYFLVTYLKPRVKCRIDEKNIVRYSCLPPRWYRLAEFESRIQPKMTLATGSQVILCQLTVKLCFPEEMQVNISGTAICSKVLTTRRHNLKKRCFLICLYVNTRECIQDARPISTISTYSSSTKVSATDDSNKIIKKIAYIILGAEAILVLVALYCAVRKCCSGSKTSRSVKASKSSPEIYLPKKSELRPIVKSYQDQEAQSPKAE